ncbi:MAG: hypothetical protein ABW116_08550 [Candidatus Sedimenticola sp. 20ELBAFRAG]
MKGKTNNLQNLLLELTDKAMDRGIEPMAMIHALITTGVMLYAKLDGKEAATNFLEQIARHLENSEDVVL